MKHLTDFPSHKFNAFIALVLLIALLSFSGCVSSRTFFEGLAKTPHHPVQDSSFFRTFNSFQQDFLYLTEIVRETHPEPYAAWSKEEFDEEQRRLMAALGTDTSRITFERFLNSFLSHLKDSHTSAQTTWMSGQLQYPVSFFWIKDTLFLASVGREKDTALIGCRVLSFNSVPTLEVLARFAHYIAYDNIYQARRTLQFYFVFPALHRDAGVIQSDTLELNLLTREGLTHSYRILPVQKPTRFHHYQSHPITQKVNRMFKYTILKKEKACYFQWNTMFDLRVAGRFSFPTNLLFYPVAWYMGIGYFENFLEDMLEEMNKEGVTTLIIDARGNGGGAAIYGDQLLYHLDVPFNVLDYSTAIRFSPLYREFFPDTYRDYASRYEQYTGKKMPDSLIITSDFVKEDTSQEGYFRGVTNPKSDYYIKPDRLVFKGTVYVLVGDGTYSSAIILSTLIKDNKLFTIVGQPTRGRPSHYGEMLVVKLPNSGIVCTISCKKFFRPDITKDSEDSLYPDVEIWPTFEDLKNGRDPVLEWVLRDAKNESTSAK